MVKVVVTVISGEQLSFVTTDATVKENCLYLESADGEATIIPLAQIRLIQTKRNGA